MAINRIPSTDFSFSASASYAMQIDNGIRQTIHPIAINLPNDYLEGIGRVVVHWSCQEWLLQRILFIVASNDDPKVGRLTVGQPRARDAAARIKQVTDLKKITLSIDFTDLGKKLEAAEINRDLIGHGIWIRDQNDRLCVVSYAGNWSAGEYQGTSRRIEPEAKPIDLPFMEKVVDDIKVTMSISKKLRDEIECALNP